MSSKGTGDVGSEFVIGRIKGIRGGTGGGTTSGHSSRFFSK